MLIGTVGVGAVSFASLDVYDVGALLLAPSEMTIWTFLAVTDVFREGMLLVVLLAITKALTVGVRILPAMLDGMRLVFNGRLWLLRLARLLLRWFYCSCHTVARPCEESWYRQQYLGQPW